jgi:ATP-dependent Lon protease
LPGLGPSVPPADLNAAIGFIGVLQAVTADPDGVKKLIADLQAQQAALEKAKAESEAASAKAQQDIAESEAMAARSNALIEKSAQRAADLDKMEKDLAERLKAFGKEQQQFADDSAAATKVLADREYQVGQRENLAQVKENQVRIQFEEYEAKRAALDARIAKFKELAG